MMGLPQKLTLRSWLLVTLLPTIGVLAVIYSLATYRGLHGIVLDGFDQKLKAVGTVTAALIEPEDHEALMRTPDVVGLSTRPDQAGLWTLRRDGDIYIVNPATGYASPSVGQTPAPFTLVAADSLPGAEPLSILMIDGSTGQVARYYPASAEVEPLGRIIPPIRLIATDPTSTTWWTLGDELRRVDLATGDTVALGTAPTGVSSLTYDPDRDVLWALAEPGNVLLALDPSTGESTARIGLQFDPTDESGFVAADRRVALRAIGYDPSVRTLFATGDSLLRIDPTTGFVSMGDLISAFGREQSQIYLHYVTPMRALQNLADTKYLYTQRHDEADHITYGLDASIGEEHAPLLSIDTIPASAIEGISDLQENGTLYISGIQEWDQWGLIKSVFVPIFDPVSGTVVAMAGADIDITTIRFETHRALVVTLGAGIALLIAAGAYSLLISRQLTDPLHAIREGALRAAAGHYRQKLVIKRPRELRNLAVAFSASTVSIDELIQSSAQQAAQRRQTHAQTSLNTRLAQLIAPAFRSANRAWGHSSGTDDPNSPSPASGLVSIAGGSLLWLDATTTKPNQAHAINAATARRLAEAYGDDREGLTRTLSAIAVPSTGWFFLPPEGAVGTLHGPAEPTSPWAQISWDNDRGTVFVCPHPEQPLPPDVLAGTHAGDVCDAVLANLPSGHFVLVNRP
jgi:hypothetical protein